MWNNWNLLCRLETYKKRFFPRTISVWHDLTGDSQSKHSVENFKKQFAVECIELQILYYYCERWPCVHHTRMRIRCSKLNNDLFNNLHIIDSPSGTCGVQNENVEHFFLYCPHFNIITCHFIGDIQVLMPLILTIFFWEILTMIPNQTLKKRVFKPVYQYITDS